MLNKARLGQQKVEFYGIVLDQWEKPVEGARVSYQISAYGFPAPINKYGKTATDADGKFEIHGGAAAILYIKDILLQGYEFSYAMNEKRSFDYDRSYTSRHQPDRSAPFVFRLRKRMAPGTYLLKKEFSVWLQADKGVLDWARDLEKGWNANARRRNNPEVFWDLEATAKVDPEKREWIVTFSTNGENSGLLLRDELLHEAPEGGYEKSLDVVFPFEDRRFPVKYLYVRLREPGFFSRFKINDYSKADEKRLYRVQFPKVGSHYPAILSSSLS